jgi:Amt family ammonium transporter
VTIVKRRFKVDDALDVLGVHGVGGAFGSIALPFATLAGVGGTPLTRGIVEQFGVQLLGVGSVAIWSAVLTVIIVKTVALTTGLRAKREAEIQGLDFISHGEAGYHVNLS